MGIKRQQITCDQERIKRQYRKRGTEYWSQTIKETRSKKRKISTIPTSQQQEPEQLTSLEVDNLQAWEVKEKLKNLGIKTHVRKIEKLREMLRKALVTY